jgi:hypothetical protein
MTTNHTRPYGDFTIAELLGEREDQDVASAMISATKAAITDELQMRFGFTAAGALGRDSGTWTGDAYPAVIKGVAAKKVEWDSEKLLNLAMTMSMAEAVKVFDFGMKIKEKTYSGLSGELRTEAEKARTVKISDIKFTIERCAY